MLLWKSELRASPCDCSVKSRVWLVNRALHNIVLCGLRVILYVICNHILFKILLLLCSNPVDTDYWYCSLCSLRDKSGTMVVCKNCELNWKAQGAYLTMQETSQRYVWVPCNPHTLTGSKTPWMFLNALHRSFPLVSCLLARSSIPPWDFFCHLLSKETLLDSDLKV